MNGSTVNITHTIKAPIAQVFAAWSEPEMMQCWLFPWDNGTGNTQNDFKVGGQFQHNMQDSEDGTLYPHSGEYKEIDAPHKIMFTWNSPVVEDSLLTIIFQEIPEGTEVVLTHEGFPSEEICQMHFGGWEGCFKNLEKYLAK